MAINNRYIEEIANQQPLTDIEEQELAARIKIGDASALEKLTKANLKFVVSLAHQYKNRGLNEDDLISEGNIGMMYAAQKFDGTRGIRFVKFAATYIRKAMEEAINEQIEINNTQDNGEKKHSIHTLSIDQPLPIGSNGNFTLQSVIENKNSPQADEHLTRQIIAEKIAKGMNILDERQKEVITLIFGLKDGEIYTMAEIAKKIGIKRERVRQIRNKALRKLQKYLK